MASFARFLLRGAAQTLPKLTARTGSSIMQTYGYKRSLPPMLMEMKRRRKKAGPEPLRHRSVWVEWNYDCEIYAFAKRLGETWSDETLRTAFVQQSFVEREAENRRELGMPLGDDGTLSLTPNTDLALAGRQLCDSYADEYLVREFPQLPREGVNAVKEHLMSDQVLSHVSKNIGTSDLIFCADFPPEQTTLANVLMALVGGLARDCGKDRACLFVRDFVLAQLVGKDVNELWVVDKPIERLASLLQEQGMSPAEPRLLWDSGRTTLEASYCVGFYSDKKLLGSSVGETVEIAQEMAARDALRRWYGLELNRAPLSFGRQGGELAGEAKRLAAETATS
ncbi:hypothetical protein HPB47_011499 [Ixodes persulcatus]|uniref:Uncharacterized protein n=1 Tax=Ixodes persulcatus TaxID=34615 RepID=A0AC60NWB9_IXOPE|nr:hypothetical protein HPB47_011499 [Ixodes persulcatus]